MEAPREKTFWSIGQAAEDFGVRVRDLERAAAEIGGIEADMAIGGVRYLSDAKVTRLREFFEKEHRGQLVTQ